MNIVTRACIAAPGLSTARFARTGWLVLLLFGSLLAAPCAGEEETSFSVSGRLVTREGSPVPACGVRIEARKTGLFEEAEKTPSMGTHTDGEGRFVFEALPKGIYGLRFLPAGEAGGVFRFKTQYADILSSNLLLLGEDVRLGDLTLFKTGLIITGAVYLNGKALEGAEVFYLDKRRFEGRARAEGAVSSTTSGKDGRFTLKIPGFVPGERVHVAARYARRRQDAESETVRWGVESRWIGDPWRTVIMDVHCSAAVCDIAGSVEDGRGEAVEGARVFLFHPGIDSPWCWIPGVQTDEAGRFRFADVAPGTWRLVVLGEGARRSQRTLHVQGDEKKEVRVVLEEAGTGSVSFRLDYDSEWGRFKEIVAKTSALRKDAPATYGVYALSEEGEFSRPVVPLAIVEVRDRIETVEISGFEPGTHRLMALPVESVGDPPGSDTTYQIGRHPRERYVPVGAASARIVIGPFEISEGKTTERHEVPRVTAKRISEYSSKIPPFVEVPAFFVKETKRRMVEDMEKRSGKK